MRFATSNGLIFEVNLTERLARCVKGVTKDPASRQWRKFAWIKPINPRGSFDYPSLGSVDLEFGSRAQIMWDRIEDGHVFATHTNRVIMASVGDEYTNQKVSRLQRLTTEGPYHHSTVVDDPDDIPPNAC